MNLFMKLLPLICPFVLTFLEVFELVSHSLEDFLQSAADAAAAILNFLTLSF